MKVYSQNVWNHNPVEYRNSLIHSMIREENADICLFQECGPETNRAGSVSLPELLKYEYTEVCPEVADKNFTPVFFKKDKYNLIDSGYFLYTGFNDVNSKSITWAVLEERDSLKCVAVVSTHFWWKFDSIEDNLQRLQNVKELKEICDDLIERYRVPIIIGGDFNNGENADQGDEPYKAMLQLGFKDLRLAAPKVVNCYTHHAYPVCNDSGIYQEGSMPDKTLDYIFLYGDFEISIQEFEIVTKQKALDSSDHCPLIASVEFLKE